MVRLHSYCTCTTHHSYCITQVKIIYTVSCTVIKLNVLGRVLGGEGVNARLLPYVSYRYPPLDEVGAEGGGGGIVVASDVRRSGLTAHRSSDRISFPEQHSETRGWISLILHTHIPYIMVCRSVFWVF